MASAIVATEDVAALGFDPVEPVELVESVDLAVEVTRVVPASGNLAVCGQQFWLGPIRAGQPVTLWMDTTVVHLLLDGVRLKTVRRG
jgi:hypothetical protein